MPTNVVINGTTYKIATQTDSPPWGIDQNALITEIVTILNTLQGSADISTTTYPLANNQVAAANITGAKFDPTQVRAAFISYSIFRSTSTLEQTEAGNLYLTYSSANSSWDMSQEFCGSSGVSLSVTTLGQLQYTTDNMATGTGYSGRITFKVFTFLD